MENKIVVIFNFGIYLVLVTSTAEKVVTDMSDTPSTYATFTQVNTLQILLNQETIVRAELQGDIITMNAKIKDMVSTLSTLKTGYNELKAELLQERSNFKNTIDKLKADLAKNNSSKQHTSDLVQKNCSCEKIKNDAQLCSLKCGALEDQLRNLSATLDNKTLQFDTYISNIEKRLKISEAETLDSKRKVLDNERILNDSVTHIENISSCIKLLKDEYRNLDGLHRASLLRENSFNKTLNTLKNDIITDDQNITELGQHIVRLQAQILTLSNDQTNISQLLHTDVIGSVQNASQNSVQPPVVFMAYVSKRTVQISEFQTITFDQLDINLGGAFNKDSSVFITPYSGVYSFTLTISTSGIGGPIAHIIRNGNGMTWLYGSSDGASSTRQASTSISVLLSAGDKIWNRWHGPKNTEIMGWPATYFSGHLVVKTV